MKDKKNSNKSEFEYDKRRNGQSGPDREIRAKSQRLSSGHAALMYPECTGRKMCASGYRTE